MAGSNGGGGAVLVQMNSSIRSIPISPSLSPTYHSLGNTRGTESQSPDRRGGRQYSTRVGSLYFMDNALQPGAGTAQDRGITPNPDRALWHAQFVRVRLILDTLKDANLVPRGAVQIGQNGPYIFVVKKDSTLDLRQ